MYIVLVDDEARICDGIARFLTNRWPDLEVAKFDNGFDALDSIALRKPNLIITDICMPEMDGMTLIEKAQALGVKHYAMLTGYDEFAFIHRALQLRTLDYLLKPVDKEQLFRVVEDVMRLEAAESEVQKANLYSSLRLLCQFNAAQDDLPIVPTTTKVFGDCALFMLLLLESEATESLQTQEEFVNLLALSTQPFSLGIDQNHNAIFILPIDKAVREQAEQKVQKLAALPSFRGFAIAPACIKALNAAYQHALEETIDDDLLLAINAYHNNAEDLKPVLSALDSLLCKTTLFHQRMAILWRFLSAVKRTQDTWVVAIAVSNYSQKREDVRRMCLLASLQALQSKIQPSTREIAMALDIIEQNYSEDLTLSQISKKVFMTPAYFSTLFHREMGQTYVDYINRLRINNACLLFLHESKMSAESIAASVGFMNSPYFFKVFKKYTSMTPGHFKELLQ